jgi:hypothetical protein
LELAKIEDEQLRHDRFIEYKAKIVGETDGETPSSGRADNLNEEDFTPNVESQKTEDSASGTTKTRNTTVSVDKMKVRLNACTNYLKKIQKDNKLTIAEKKEIETMLVGILKTVKKLDTSDTAE